MRWYCLSSQTWSPLPEDAWMFGGAGFSPNQWDAYVEPYVSGAKPLAVRWAPTTGYDAQGRPIFGQDFLTATGKGWGALDSYMKSLKGEDGQPIDVGAIEASCRLRGACAGAVFAQTVMGDAHYSGKSLAEFGYKTYRVDGYFGSLYAVDETSGGAFCVDGPDPLFRLAGVPERAISQGLAALPSRASWVLIPN